MTLMWLRKSLYLTKHIDCAGSGGDTVDVLHLDGEVSVVGSDGVTDHQGRLPPGGLIQTQALTQRSHKLLLRFRNLEVKEENTFFRKNPEDGRTVPAAAVLNLGLLLLLEHRDGGLGRLLGDVLVVLQPADFRIWRTGDVGIDPDLLSLLDADARLHACMKGDLWFFCKRKLSEFSGLALKGRRRRRRSLQSLWVLHTNGICSLDGLRAARGLTNASSILRPDPELVFHVLLQARDHVGEPRYQCGGHPLKAVTVLLNLLQDVALDGTAAVVVGSLPGDRDGLAGGIAGLHLQRWVWLLCEGSTHTRQ